MRHMGMFSLPGHRYRAASTRSSEGSAPGDEVVALGRARATRAVERSWPLFTGLARIAFADHRPPVNGPSACRMEARRHAEARRHGLAWRSCPDRLQEPARDAGPAPPLDGGPPGCRADRSPDPPGPSASSSASFARRSSASPVANAARWRRRRRVGLLEPGGDLREPGMARDERRTAGRGGLGGDHPERLREDRRDHAGVGQGEQVDEVPVLERAGEQDVRHRPVARAPRGPPRTRRSTARASRPRSASSSRCTPLLRMSLPK